MARPLLFGPVAFTLIGGSFGICWAMLYRQSPHERAQVFLEDSITPFFGGALLGLLVLKQANPVSVFGRSAAICSWRTFFVQLAVGAVACVPTLRFCHGSPIILQICIRGCD